MLILLFELFRVLWSLHLLCSLVAMGLLSAIFVAFPGIDSLDLGPVKQKASASNCLYFLIHQFKHMFWVLKSTVSLRRFF